MTPTKTTPNPRKGIPAIPMVRILNKQAQEKSIPLKIGSWESIMRAFNKYCIDTSNLN